MTINSSANANVELHIRANCFRESIVYVILVEFLKLLLQIYLLVTMPSWSHCHNHTTLGLPKMHRMPSIIRKVHFHALGKFCG
jgi:hypothetical protein